MRTIHISGKHAESRVLVGERLRHIGKYLPAGKLVVVADKKVYSLYGGLFPQAPAILLPGGEKTKSLSSLKRILAAFLKQDADRSSFVLGIGGGVICDLTGLAASIYMRGLRFGFVSTTLLSQVDASAGGKNGINFAGFKNLLGTIVQPQFVICDTELLGTLPDQERRNGLAEMVKHAMIASADHWKDIRDNMDRIGNPEEELMEKLIYDSVSIKARIVGEDEFESGSRRLLNFGHTAGHAVESVYGLPHGEAVSLGMIIASGISCTLGLLPVNEFDESRQVFRGLGLPVHRKLDPGKMVAFMQRDKKRAGSSIHFVLLSGIGSGLVRTLTFTEMEKLLREVLKDKRFWWP